MESALMLCTVLNQNGGDAPYRATHVHHPCTKWTGESLSNWIWLRTLALSLNEEFKWRYLRSEDHKSAAIIETLSLPPIEDKGITEFVQAMPEEYKVPGNAVQAYRGYYIGEKAAFATWKRRDPPEWFLRGLRAGAES